MNLGICINIFVCNFISNIAVINTSDNYTILTAVAWEYKPIRPVCLSISFFGSLYYLS